MKEVEMNANCMWLRECRNWESGLSSLTLSSPRREENKKGHLPRLVGHFQMIPSQVTRANATYFLVINIYNTQNTFPNS